MSRCYGKGVHIIYYVSKSAIFYLTCHDDKCGNITKCCIGNTTLYQTLCQVLLTKSCNGSLVLRVHLMNFNIYNWISNNIVIRACHILFSRVSTVDLYL